MLNIGKIMRNQEFIEQRYESKNVAFITHMVDTYIASISIPFSISLRLHLQLPPRQPAEPVPVPVCVSPVSGPVASGASDDCEVKVTARRQLELNLHSS